MKTFIISTAQTYVILSLGVQATVLFWAISSNFMHLTFSNLIMTFLLGTLLGLVPCFSLALLISYIKTFKEAK